METRIDKMLFEVRRLIYKHALSHKADILAWMMDHSILLAYSSLPPFAHLPPQVLAETWAVWCEMYRRR